MKKFRVALVTALVLLVSMFCLVACGSVEGTYKFESMSGSMEGVSIDVKAGESFMGMTLTEDAVTLTLEKDGVAKMKAFGSAAEATGTWEEKDGNIEVTIAGDKTVFKKSGSKLVSEEDGMKLTLKK